MNTLWVIIRREYRERIRQKVFLFSTIIGLLVILGLSFAPAIFDKIKSADHMDVTVLERTGRISLYLDNELNDLLPNGKREFEFRSVKAEPDQWEEKRTSLIKEMSQGIGTAFILEVFPPDNPNEVILHSKKTVDSTGYSKIKTALQQMVIRDRAQGSGLSQAELTNLFKPLNFVTKKEGLRAESQDQQFQNIALVYLLLFMLYFSLVIYGMYVANGVIEEKSSRVMEMMLATVKPAVLMAGKIIGVGLVGITQYILWIGAGIGLLSLKGSGVTLAPGMSFRLAAVSPSYLIYFGLFFLLGFMLYASVYAGIGSMVSRVEDTNQVATPVTMVIVLSFMLAMFSLNSPDNPWIISLSYVPFFTPMLLFSRIVLTHVSFQSIAFGISEMLVTIILLMWLAGKAYRAGVLMYGKISWKDIIKAVVQK